MNHGETTSSEVERGAQPEPDGAPLLDEPELRSLRDRWQSIQTRFVDEPQGAVEQADSLVDELMQRLARSFADERERLERQWASDEEVSTEDLRVTFTRYRSFFDRLLST